MHTYTFFEHQTRSLRELGLTADNRILLDLERLNSAQGVEFIRVGRHGVTAGHYVGVLRLGDVTFQILPKIDYDGDSDAVAGTPQQHRAAASAMQNLLYLLSYTDDLKLYHREVTALGTQPADWFELLTRIFAEELHSQIRRGLEHAYVHREERLTTLRGTWQIERQITRPPFERHLFDVAYDEFGTDTALNRVLRLVASRLLALTRDRRNATLLRDIDSWLSGVHLLSGVGSRELDQVHFTRLNVRFRPVFNLAHLFLGRMGQQLMGQSQDLFAFVFDMNLLFERFMAAFLHRHRAQIFEPPFEDMGVIAQTAGMRMSLAQQWPGGFEVFRLKPDILLTSSKRRVQAIIDTKYKRLKPEQVRYGVSEADIYQMLAYSVRFRCGRSMLLYPAAVRSGKSQTAYSILDFPTTIHIHTIDLRQPLNRPERLISELRQSMRDLLRGS